MNQFVNRNGTNLNKKRLKVVQVIKDVNTDEITELYVEEYRADTVDQNNFGTPLNAENLNQIIQNMIDEKLEQHNLIEGSNSNNNETVTEPYDFEPKNYSNNWLQYEGSLNDDLITIQSSNGQNLYAEIINNYSSSIYVDIIQNNSNIIKVLVQETNTLNAASGSTSNFNFQINIYSDIAKTDKVGTYNGVITYYFASVSPDD